jgi:hypothetical protein
MSPEARGQLHLKCQTASGLKPVTGLEADASPTDVEASGSLRERDAGDVLRGDADRQVEPQPLLPFRQPRHHEPPLECTVGPRLGTVIGAASPFV